MTDSPPKNALTDEEWADALNGVSPKYMHTWIDAKRGTIDIDTTGGDYAPTEYEPEKLMALGNAALPDGSPYKITQADVSELRGMASFAREMSGYTGTGLIRIAAKLSALLPPNPQ